MKRTIIIATVATLLVASSCSNERVFEDLQTSTLDQTTEQVDPSVAYETSAELTNPGMVYIKMDARSAEQLRQAGEISLQTFASVASEIEVASRRLGVKSVERVFFDTGAYTERHRRYGLDRWYIVHYDESRSVDDAVRTFAAVPQFEYVEPSYRVEVDGQKPVPVQLHSAPAFAASAVKPRFNDPMLPEQWHYNNYGTSPGAVEDADINLDEAWTIETGKPNVIIAVVDDGIDVTHDDLVLNLWRNPKVTQDTPITDKNGAGIIEQPNGVNAIPQGRVGNHGTHVAGTVAARNHNNIGVAGVAGGNGDVNSGVRIMACMAIDSRDKAQRGPSHPERALVYAADHGAVIAQNSWGLPPNAPLPEVVKVAIDYFIDNAGKDSQGNQLQDSPMKGGVVIFAAGNDNEDAPCYPAAYDRVIAVAAMAPNFTRSSFTNRGPWVDIMAPGGDQNRFGDKAGVLSCLPGNNYGYYQGTSMACPHVSGIAGLIVSHHGKQGYTNEQLKQAILSSLRPEDVDAYNPLERGRLGRGYIDASIAFALDQKKAPNVPQRGAAISSTYTSIDISWVVTQDEDDKLPTFQYLYISDQPISAAQLRMMKSRRLRVNVGAAGEEMNYTFTGLRHSTKYYIAVVSEDRWGNVSEPGVFEVSTRLNQAPKLTVSGADQKIFVSGNRVAKLTFSASDPDGHRVKCRIDGEAPGVSFTDNQGRGSIQIRSVLPEGEHSFTLVAEDEFGAETRQQVTFYIVMNKPLRLKGDFSSLVVGVDEIVSGLSLADNIEHNPHLPLHLKVRSSDNSVVIASVGNKGELLLSPVAKGRATIYVTATDDAGGKLETSIKVQIVSDATAPVHIVYPIPVKTKLNLMLNEKIAGAKVKIVSLSGQLLLETPVKSVGKSRVVSVNVANLTPNTYRLIVESTNMPVYEQLFVK